MIGSAPMKKEEKQNQKALIKWFKFAFPNYDGLLFAINNSEYIADEKMRAAKGKDLKDMGVVAGTPDLMLAIPVTREVETMTYGRLGPKRVIENIRIPGMFIEMKSKDGKLSASQKAAHERLIKQGYKVVTCYHWEEAEKEINRYLNW